MSIAKKMLRAQFRREVFARDENRCQCCGLKVLFIRVEELMDAHHITPREQMPNGGYVKENGITLCKGTNGTSCHEEAEAYLCGTSTNEKYAPATLYALIGSSHSAALAASEELRD